MIADDDAKGVGTSGVDAWYEAKALEEGGLVAEPGLWITVQPASAAILCRTWCIFGGGTKGVKASRSALRGGKEPAMGQGYIRRKEVSHRRNRCSPFPMASWETVKLFANDAFQHRALGAAADETALQAPLLKPTTAEGECMRIDSMKGEETRGKDDPVIGSTCTCTLRVTVNGTL
ncbi:hypothetical protein BDZ89DRAFT_1041482 [Hymenopellis radicata]|nr:hypothetical protein BDZ89DRAFT_1041482 [Hymenopellis radicata]